MTDYITQLASTIQGEASSQEGQFAVASVMQNRVDQNIDTPQSLLSVGSFEANQSFTTPSPFAMQMAQAVAANNVGQYGNTGNATYYNAAGTNAAYDAGGSIIGGNAFSNQFNQTPNANYQAPQYGGSSSSPTSAPGSVTGLATDGILSTITGAASGAASWFTGGPSALNAYFIRGACLIVGFIFIAIGLSMFKATAPIVAPVIGAAKRLPLAAAE